MAEERIIRFVRNKIYQKEEENQEDRRSSGPTPF
jgi:hypothetical protein